MKSFIALAILALTLPALANVDKFLGTYKTRNGKGEAEITKVLVEEADLFNPAKYEYRLTIEGPKELNLWEEPLEIGAGGKTLVFDGRNECDDPGCNYLESVVIEVSQKTPSAKPTIAAEYEGHHYADGDTEGYDFSGKALFTKR
jgi:hypothetical protein